MSDAGKDYNEKVARKAGLRPDETGHMPSRVPSGEREGLILKRPSHPTFGKTIEGERVWGGTFYRRGGRLYSFDQKPDESFRPVPYDRLERKVERAQAHRQESRGGRR